MLMDVRVVLRCLIALPLQSGNTAKSQYLTSSGRQNVILHSLVREVICLSSYFWVVLDALGDL